MPGTMLALSTFRQADKAVELALEKAAEAGPLVVVFVVDVNVARYLVGTDVGLYPDLWDRGREEFLEEQRLHAAKAVSDITARAEKRGIAATSRVVTGRFGIECMKAIEEERPGLIVTTRSKRPAWVRRFFGSPVDYLIANAGCPLLEA